jgi:hypothetical protein
MAALAALLSVGMVAFTGSLAPGQQPAQAAPAACVPPADYWVNGSQGGQDILRRYAPDGTPLSQVTLSGYYGDIAWTVDGSELWAVTFDTSPAQLLQLDPDTGAVLRSRELSFPGPAMELGMIYSVDTLTNGLSPYLDPVRGPGFLLGSNSSTRVFFVPEAGPADAVVWAGWPDTGGDRTVSAGDFITLEDGSILGLGVGLDDSGLLASGATAVRFSSDGSTGTVVGTLPWTFGAAKSASAILLVLASGGEIDSIDQDKIPHSYSMAALPVTQSVMDGTVEWAGATSTQDARTCPPPAPAYTLAKTADIALGIAVEPGHEITYTVKVVNTGNVAYPSTSPAAFSDDLSDVLDDAVLVGAPVASAGSVAVSGDELTWSGALGIGETATVTYVVRVAASTVRADSSLRNVVTPTAGGGSCAPGGCVTDNPLGSSVPASLTDPSLADTGASTAAPVGLIGLLLAAGAVLLALARVRRRRATPR